MLDQRSRLDMGQDCALCCCISGCSLSAVFYFLTLLFSWIFSSVFAGNTGLPFAGAIVVSIPIIAPFLTCVFLQGSGLKYVIAVVIALFGLLEFIGGILLIVGAAQPPEKTPTGPEGFIAFGVICGVCALLTSFFYCSAIAGIEAGSGTSSNGDA